MTYVLAERVAYEQYVWMVQDRMSCSDIWRAFKQPFPLEYIGPDDVIQLIAHKWLETQSRGLYGNIS
tara:strand:- start:721 stop:921 length:201 start_codon:yes stop_codon:yes gene_type:complete